MDAGDDDDVNFYAFYPSRISDQETDSFSGWRRTSAVEVDIKVKPTHPDTYNSVIATNRVGLEPHK